MMRMVSSSCSPSISDENTRACSVDSTRPPRRYMAASNEKRVRVDGS